MPNRVFLLVALLLLGMTATSSVTGQSANHIVSPEVSLLLRSATNFPALYLASAEVSVLRESQVLVSTTVSILRETVTLVSAEVSVRECVAGPIDHDCDLNGVDDDCELVMGDLNDNGILDVCEMAPEVFIRGDANLDQQVNTSDAVLILGYLFSGSSVTCLAALDTNDSESVSLADAFHLLCYLFNCGPVPTLPPPHPGCGTDPTLGTLVCPPAPGGCP